MHLSQIEIGQWVMIREIRLGSSDRIRLAQLGITAGTKIRFMATTLFRDPLLFQVGTALVALRKRDVDKIIVERVET